MQFEFILNPHRQSSNGDFLTVGGRRIPLTLIRSSRARRYVLRLRPDGSARITIPRSGSPTEARRFAQRSLPWLERQLKRMAGHPTSADEWWVGTEILFRGQSVKIETSMAGEANTIRFGGEIVKVASLSTNLRPAIESHLWQLAARELPPRVLEFAALHHLHVRRITVRNQKSRWGSCSQNAAISLNWRLIQTPQRVQDYIAIHELIHLKEMNHSARFWDEVERACPDYKTAERWLKEHSSLLR